MGGRWALCKLLLEEVQTRTDHHHTLLGRGTHPVPTSPVLGTPSTGQLQQLYKLCRPGHSYRHCCSSKRMATTQTCHPLHGGRHLREHYADAKKNEGAKCGLKDTCSCASPHDRAEDSSQAGKQPACRTGPAPCARGQAALPLVSSRTSCSSWDSAPVSAAPMSLR